VSDAKPPSIVTRVFVGAVMVFVAAWLLVRAVELVVSVWPALAIGAASVGVIGFIVWRWRRKRDGW
jgi:hypothetical protein